MVESKRRSPQSNEANFLPHYTPVLPPKHREQPQPQLAVSPIFPKTMQRPFLSSITSVIISHLLVVIC